MQIVFPDQMHTNHPYYIDLLASIQQTTQIDYLINAYDEVSSASYLQPYLFDTRDNVKMYKNIPASLLLNNYDDFKKSLMPLSLLMQVNFRNNLNHLDQLHVFIRPEKLKSRLKKYSKLVAAGETGDQFCVGTYCQKN